jgi:hypothetical protein
MRTNHFQFPQLLFQIGQFPICPFQIHAFCRLHLADRPKKLAELRPVRPLNGHQDSEFEPLVIYLTTPNPTDCPLGSLANVTGSI